jgi:outer membrane usher protein
LEKDPAALKQLVSLPDRDDQVALAALQKVGVEVRYRGGRIEFGPRGDGMESPGYSKPVSSRLNPTGRTIVLNVPLMEGGTRLGEVLVRIEPDGTIIVPKASLVQQLASVLDQAALARLEKMPDKNGLVALGVLSGGSFRLTYNPNQMELAFNPAIEQRPLKDLNYARSGLTGGGSVAPPATVSGFVNISGGADYSWEKPNIASLYLDLQSAVRVAGIVIENDITYEGDLDPLQCPIGARCLYEHVAGLKRRYSRVVYDLPEQKVRVQFGDVEQQTTSFQHATDVLGVGLEKSPRKLAPGEALSPTVGSFFSIERPSDVDVVINGAITQRLRLRPGNYSIRDLPLVAGANEIELIIMDDRGQRRTVVLSTFSDAKMLATGKSEWALSGGVPSYLVDGERAYQPGEYLASGLYRLGLTDRLSLEVQVKGGSQAVEGGAGFLAATPFGVFGMSSAVSSSDIGVGVGANLNWDLVNLRGLVGTWSGARESLRFSAEYRSTLFRTPGDSLIASNGILYPETPYWLRLTSGYSIPMGASTTASFSARYQFADPHQPTYTPFRIDGDRYGADVTLSTRLGPRLSTSLTAGYSNEITQRAFANPQADAIPEARVMLRFFILPTDGTRISGSYDSLNHSTSVSAYQGVSTGVQRWEADINAQMDEKAQQKQVNASLLYSGNRGEIRIVQSASVDDLAVPQGGTYVTDRSSVRFGTAIVFADGRFGIGPPIRGNGFALVYPHESLADKPIIVGDASAPRAFVDGLGPAVVPDLPAYTEQHLGGRQEPATGL